VAESEVGSRPDDISPETWKILTASATATSHHWVPRMVLRNFTEQPGGKDPEIWRQPVRRGAPQRSRVGAECAIRDHNTLESTKLPPKALEGLYAYIESKAGPALRKLLDGTRCDEENRGALALLIAAQYIRMPRTRSVLRHVSEQTATLKLIVNASTERQVWRARARDTLTTPDGETPTGEEIDAFINDIVRRLESGSVRMHAPHDFDAGSGLFGLEDLAQIIYKMAWIGLKAPANTLVLGDHPLVIHDPAAGPDQPAAWLSSNDVEVTFPLAANFCLRLHHQAGPPSYQERGIDRYQAEAINLRSIAHAWRHYYGPTQQCVQNARQLAKRDRMRVAVLRPVPGGTVVAHRIQGATQPHRVEVHHAPDEIKVSRAHKR